MEIEESVIFDINSHHVATITLNRPHLRNAFDEIMIQKLISLLCDLKENHKPRVLILRGNGPAFCAGADLSWMKRSAGFSKSQNLEDARQLAVLMETLDTLPFPTITYAHGAVFGGGIGLLACSDLVIAAESTLLALSETRLGLVPAVISPYVLRSMGPLARRYMLSGERFTATQAQHMGLVHEVVDAMDSEYLIYENVTSFLKGGPQSQAIIKQMIRDVESVETHEETQRMTIQLIADVRSSEEAQKGLLAFFEKTSPKWAPEGS
ncbi:Enoyl-CoA hydratase/isomerase family protein [Candidatus Bealeia paramacronuclearis]|uniref:Enoyl-CoA hydratase/isomerase family protein n=1 Tax=Candidatus Bealeia paramacronuclearis TaxID=1921001 RepID=A0ABZ2C4C0_9PROT|nr:Enoyl-CoA hydratase/isomerase family protein [Candidatus Bealeia paramacronuclearis]